MRRCEDCRIILDPDVRFCPKCGKAIEEEAAAAGPPRVEVGALLTSANLHRIREEWDEAIADATEALKLEPGNADIASLLGSIYEQRGMLDEAVIWYHLALELDPKSSADRVRLERVRDQLARRSGEPLRQYQKRTRILAALIAAAFLMVVLVAVMAVRRRPAPDETPERPARRAQARATAPAPSRPSQPSGPVGAGETPAPGGAGVGGPAPAPSSLRTPAEVYIRSQIGEAAPVRETGAQVDDVTADPREGIATVTFTVPARGGVTREQVLRAAFALARAAFDANRQLNFVTARCILSAGNAQTTQIGFVGDAARASVESLPDNATLAQIEQIFTRPWWNPEVR